MPGQWPVWMDKLASGLGVQVGHGEGMASEDEENAALVIHGDSGFAPAALLRAPHASTGSANEAQVLHGGAIVGEPCGSVGCIQVDHHGGGHRGLLRLEGQHGLVALGPGGVVGVPGSVGVADVGQVVGSRRPS